MSKVNVVVDQLTTHLPMGQWGLAPAVYKGGHSMPGRGELEVWEFHTNPAGVKDALRHRDLATAARPSRDWAVVTVDRKQLDDALLQASKDKLAAAEKDLFVAAKKARETGAKPPQSFNPLTVAPVYILRNPMAYGFQREGDGLVMTLGQLRELLGEAAVRAVAARRPLSR
jgi:hypothetical protein